MTLDLFISTEFFFFAIMGEWTCSALKKFKSIVFEYNKLPLTDYVKYRNSAKCREGALLGFECLCETLGRLFEP